MLVESLELSSLEDAEENEEEEDKEEGVNLSLDRVSNLKAEAFKNVLNVIVNIIIVVIYYMLLSLNYY